MTLQISRGKWVVLFLYCIWLRIPLSAQNVGIGIIAPGAKLHILGNADASQLFIDANSTQSPGHPLIKLRNNSGVDLVWIGADNSSNVFVGLNTGRLNDAAGGATGNSFFGSLAGDSNTTGARNTAIGREALATNVAGDNATAIGYQAMRYSNSTTGTFTNTNTAIGFQSLRGSATSGNNTGTGNTVMGYQAMLNNSTGFNNAAYGRSALLNNSGGDNNTALGYQSLNDNATGNNNTATGFQASFNNTGGDGNTAYGVAALFANQAGSNATAIGYRAMVNANNQSTSFTSSNVAVGYEALRGSLSPSSNTGTFNTAIGYQSLLNNSSGSQNTGIGYHSLFGVGTGSGNTALGYRSLENITEGEHNTAIGWQAINNNSTGSNNVAIGYNVLDETIAGSNAVVIGVNAMSNYNNTTTPFINYNVAIGFETLQGGYLATETNTGNWNTAVGYQALTDNGDGNYNTAIGVYALSSNFTGDFNTALGMYALGNNSASDNTAVGYGAGSFNQNSTECTFLGYDADQSNGNGLVNSMALGKSSRVSLSNQVRVGNTSVLSIGGYASWTDLSDGRFKTAVQENVPGIEFIKLLRPVTYHVKVNELAVLLQEDRRLNKDGKYVMTTPDASVKSSRDAKEQILKTGFIAQEVEQSARSIGYDFSGVDAPKDKNGLYGLRYSEFVVPLVKAVQQQQGLIEKQTELNNSLRIEVERLTRELELLKQKIK